MLFLSFYDRFIVIMQRLDFVPPLVARLVIGGVFVPAGWGKLQNLEKVISYFESLKIPLASIQAPIAAGSELIFGLTILIGLFARISCLPLMGIMVVAIATAKKDEISGAMDLLGFSEFLYIVILLWLLVRGPGLISVDRFLLGVTGRKEAGI